MGSSRRSCRSRARKMRSRCSWVASEEPFRLTSGTGSEESNDEKNSDGAAVTATRGDRRGAEIVLDLFGSNLQQQGRGLYVGLELLAICKGVIEAGGELLAD